MPKIVPLSLLCCIALTVGGSLVGCGSHQSESSSNTLSAPTTVNLYPTASTPENPARLFVMVTAVGSAPVTLPLAFDTGSSGITLDALQILPPDLVTPDGFIFPPGESQLVYEGITVTDQQGTRTYGGAGGRTEIGNIGYATVTFGDAASTLTTRVMPVFLYYAVQLNDTHESAAPQQQQGWFGVNDAPNAITIAGSVKPASGYPECTLGVVGTCFVASVLKYLDYSSGIDAGFLLQPAPLRSCDISAFGSCIPAPMLTVGLTPTLLSGFTTATLDCTWSPGEVPQEIQGYSLCQDGIPGTTVAAVGESFTATVLFDSGTPFVAVYVPPTATFPTNLAPNTPLTVTTPGGFHYTLAAGTGLDEVTVTPNSTAQSIVGLGYFTTNSFFIDFSNSIEGWK